MGSGKGNSSRSSRSSKRAPAECSVSKCDRAVACYSNGKDADYCKPRERVLKVLSKSITYRTSDCCEFGPRCNTRTRSKDKFCDKHSECAWLKCNTKLLDVEGGDFKYSNIGHGYWLCRDHSCKAKDKDKQCYEERDKNSQYCTKHSKEFQCKFTNCDSDRDDSERYCKKHHCEVADCHHRTYILPHDEMLARDGRRCIRHQCCIAPGGCKGYSLLNDKGEPTKLCANHGKCQFLHGCDAIVQGDSRFCTEHECDQPDCLQPRDVHQNATMRWCHIHLCSAPGCPNFANGHGHAHPQKCFRHTCQRRDCSEIVKDSNPNSNFCQTHACADPTCPNESTIPSGYCLTHVCTTPGCRAPRERGSPFFAYLCRLHGDERLAEQQEIHYIHTATPSRATSRSGSRASSYDSRRRPRTYADQEYYHSAYRDPVQAAEAHRRYGGMNREYMATPRMNMDWAGYGPYLHQD
ncbi:hypothetical protein FOMA001_g2582 [Fusarium oxysporum f. sp. matthiolae]|nr:hypothetical protein FOMA001_g2582 [Fusarium oxysporum f. sp. matthiolae]